MQQIEKEILINGKPINFAISLETNNIYYAAFRSHILIDINSVDSKCEAGVMKLVLHIIPRIMWAMAKTANKNIPHMDKWYQYIGPFDTLSVYDEFIELMEKVSEVFD